MFPVIEALPCFTLPNLIFRASPSGSETLVLRDFLTRFPPAWALIENRFATGEWFTYNKSSATSLVGFGSPAGTPVVTVAHACSDEVELAGTTLNRSDLDSPGSNLFALEMPNATAEQRIVVVDNLLQPVGNDGIVSFAPACATTSTDGFESLAAPRFAIFMVTVLD